MKKSLPIALVAIFLPIASGSFYPDQVIGAPKAEDDFQLLKVADGVYAALAKPGGLAWQCRRSSGDQGLQRLS